MPIFELHIAGEVVRDEDINALYKAISFTDVPWKIFRYEKSRMNKVEITRRFGLTPKEIDCVYKDRVEGWSMNDISKRRSIPLHSVSKILNGDYAK